MKPWEDPTVIREASMAAIQLYAYAQQKQAINKERGKALFSTLSALIAHLFVNSANIVKGGGK